MVHDHHKGFFRPKWCRQALLTFINLFRKAVPEPFSTSHCKLISSLILLTVSLYLLGSLCANHVLCILYFTLSRTIIPSLCLDLFEDNILILQWLMLHPSFCSLKLGNPLSALSNQRSQGHRILHLLTQCPSGMVQLALPLELWSLQRGQRMDQPGLPKAPPGPQQL